MNNSKHHDNTASQKSDKKGTYHHGNLQESLLDCALQILEQGGPQALSMRALAEAVGVSRTALYHHFKNKEDLLAALATQGFSHLNKLISQPYQAEQALREQVLKLVSSYLRFADEHAALYDLMFGESLWSSEEETPTQRHAKDCFRHYVSLFEALQAQQHIASDEPPLRLAQVFWAALHGMAKLMNDNILTLKDDRDVLAEHLVNRFI